MSYEDVAKSYKANAVETASPGKIILMLFDGAIRFLDVAKEGFTENDTKVRNETINNNITKAQNIILELQSSLNIEAGGEFAQTMFGLYDYISKQLNEANAKKEQEPIDSSLKILHELRGAWHEMLKQTEQKPSTNSSRTFSSSA